MEPLDDRGVTESQWSASSIPQNMSTFHRHASLCWLVACVIAGITGCGTRDDPAKTTAFFESYDRAMKKIAAICARVSEQVSTARLLTSQEKAVFIIVYGRAAADVKLDDAPESLRACRDGVNNAFAKLRSTTAEVMAKATAASNQPTTEGRIVANVEVNGIADAAAPAVQDALQELRRAADSCKRDTEQIALRPISMVLPFGFATRCL